MLYKLLSATDRTRFEPQVISLLDKGTLGPRIERLDIPVHTLGMRRGLASSLLTLVRLAALLRRLRPRLLQTWMYHADLFGGLGARALAELPVVWGIRQNEIGPDALKASTRMVLRLCAALSRRLPRRIICCSEAALIVHSRAGYDSTRMVVIPNGFDARLLRPDPEARRRVREELGIAEDTLLVGRIARFDQQKDHHNLIRAFALLRTRLPEARLLLCGTGITWENRQLTGWIDAAGIRDQTHLLGERHDIPRINAALDLAVSSSFSESFPNVLGEAMACGIPCVTTDTGDSANIVGDTGRVVPPRDPQQLAAAIAELLDSGDEMLAQLGRAARQRILDNYALERIARRYERLYLDLLAVGKQR